ncbi:hypothetical protein [Rappaport israeli]|uniref:hypothetical protein n=1 Tax=Rappaport israeli TaxID=1839807 RepID=UPI0009312DE6|nr:hypothetical protein [Rappaport israeli]
MLANYLALISALYLIARRARQLTIAFFPSTRQALLAKDALLRLLRLNSDLFIRTLMLVLCLSWFQRLASGLGENIIAANLLLLWHSLLQATP